MDINNVNTALDNFLDYTIASLPELAAACDKIQLSVDRALISQTNEDWQVAYSALEEFNTNPWVPDDVKKLAAVISNEIKKGL